MLRILSILLVTLLPILANAQADTIVAYDILTKTTGTILPVNFNATVTADHSSSSVGLFGNKAFLNSFPPSTNLFPGSNFSDLALATSFFKLTDYPIRTTVSLRHYMDTIFYKSSGMIINPCFVLTSGNCVLDFGLQDFHHFDSIRVFPAFNNGQKQAGLPSARIKKIYLFKSFLDGHGWEDIALLELDEPIGLLTGWTGMSFNTSPNFLNGKVFHKFSYPASNPFNQVKTYNGDTLYYNYGYIQEFSNWLGVPNANAFPGQGGSTFMYTDNMDYYSVGLCSFSSSYYHYRITPGAFYNLSHVMANQACDLDYYTSLKENPARSNALKLFPNPFSAQAILQFDYDPSEDYSLQIMDLLGRTVQIIQVDSGEVKISSGGLASGVYLLQLRTWNTLYICKMAVE